MRQLEESLCSRLSVSGNELNVGTRKMDLAKLVGSQKKNVSLATTSAASACSPFFARPWGWMNGKSQVK